MNIALIPAGRFMGNVMPLPAGRNPSLPPAPSQHPGKPDAMIPPRDSGRPSWEGSVILDLSTGAERVPTAIPGLYYHPNDTKAPQAQAAQNQQPASGCGTCASRTYQDQSGDMGVSFQNGASVAPEAAASHVFAHEREHAAIAHQEAQRTGGHADTSIRVHTSICPDCKKVYVSGGEARVSITPSEEDAMDLYKDPAESLIGQMLDIAV